MLATFWGVPGYDAELTDYSPEGWARRLELQRRTIGTLGELQHTEPARSDRRRRAVANEPRPSATSSSRASTTDG